MLLCGYRWQRNSEEEEEEGLIFPSTLERENFLEERSDPDVDS